ncbi:MAG TPA: hypothetical protein VL981_00005, partial [Candidatus Methylacidiphilales bacterium]|nr:hypothetical protein [Candidatus Methylacidiphilales bacterium]
MTAIPHGRRYPCILILPALAVALLCAGQIHIQAAGDETSPLVPPSMLSGDTFASVNATAHGLAGEHSPDGAPWESASEWRDYQQSIDGRWSYLERVRLSAMDNWANSELGGLRQRCNAVFYPFSGPDFLYVNTMFPDSRYLLMAGLEPVGSTPDLAKLQEEGKLGPYLAEMKASLYTILLASFFKTKDMKTDFNNQLVDGLMPAIIVFLARQGYTIDAIDYVTLRHDGSLVRRGDGSGAPGVQIAYDKGDRGDLRYLFYFQTDLGNDGLHSNPGYVRLMQKLGPGITYLKAASYLLYEDYFSTIRDGILDNSFCVVEDDSGIPFRDFKPGAWEVTPYGNYTGPIPLFKEHYQPDLADFYARTPHSPLPFGSGYKFVAS